MYIHNQGISTVEHKLKKKKTKYRITYYSIEMFDDTKKTLNYSIEMFDSTKVHFLELVRWSLSRR